MHQVFRMMLFGILVIPAVDGIFWIHQLFEWINFNSGLITVVKITRFFGCEHYGYKWKFPGFLWSLAFKSMYEG